MPFSLNLWNFPSLSLREGRQPKKNFYKCPPPHPVPAPVLPDFLLLHKLSMDSNHYLYISGLPGGASGKDPACQRRRRKRCGFNPWVGKVPWKSTWQPTPVFLPRESPRTEEPGRSHSMESQRFGHDWSNLARLHSCTFQLAKNTVPLQNHQFSFLLEHSNLYIHIYKELARMVMEAEKSKRPVFKRLESQESQSCKFQSKFKSEGKSRLMSQLKDRQKKNEFFLTQILSRPSVDWMRPPKFGVPSALLSLQIQKLISSRNTFTDTPRIMFNQVSGPRGTVKLTINKINHHNLPPEKKTKQNLSPLTSTSSPITLPSHSLLQWNFSEDLCLSPMLPPSEACPLSRPMKCQTLPQCPYST